MNVAVVRSVSGRSTRGRSAVAGWGAAIGLAVAAMGWAWWWSRQLVAHPLPTPTHDSWEQVKTEFPLPPESVESAAVPEAMLEGIVRANPFDVERRRKPPETGAGAAQGRARIEPPAPKLVYKGRVNLGSRQRAILEDTAAHKTHFLEVGQEVAGCKLLDIQETQVILSTLQTQEELVVSLETPNRASAPAGPARHVGSP